MSAATVSRETGRDPGAPVSRETDTAARPGGPPPSGLAARVLLAPIRLYRRLLSPLVGARCRYYPTCSHYAEQAIRELGPIRGTILAGWRLLRCNPLSPGGLDPLENRRLFRSDPDPESRPGR